MVEIRVTVDDPAGAAGLMWRLARLCDAASISFDRPRKQVRIEAEWESRAVVGVVEGVEAWLEEDGAESATLSMGGRSYKMVRSTALAASR